LVENSGQPSAVSCQRDLIIELLNYLTTITRSMYVSSASQSEMIALQKLHDFLVKFFQSEVELCSVKLQALKRSFIAVKLLRIVTTDH
jgi:hypothetical protein